jgi:hypothetical protein
MDIVVDLKHRDTQNGQRRTTCHHQLTKDYVEFMKEQLVQPSQRRLTKTAHQLLDSMTESVIPRILQSQCGLVRRVWSRLCVNSLSLNINHMASTPLANVDLFQDFNRQDIIILTRVLESAPEHSDYILQFMDHQLELFQITLAMDQLSPDFYLTVSS